MPVRRCCDRQNVGFTCRDLHQHKAHQAAMLFDTEPKGRAFGQKVAKCGRAPWIGKARRMQHRDPTGIIRTQHDQRHGQGFPPGKVASGSRA